MTRTIAAAVVLLAGAGLLAAPGFAAQTASKAKPAPAPGQSEYAPGHQPGAAKNAAPGQMAKKKNDPKSPGASEYAPGQQGKTSTTTPATKTN